jgi:transcriptional regulator with XRE-family HTH domain
MRSSRRPTRPEHFDACQPAATQPNRFVTSSLGYWRSYSLSLRQLADQVGGFDHAYLSRMARGDRRPNPAHLRRIAKYLQLPEDYFAEVPEEAVIDAIRTRPALRDEVYFERLRRRTPRPT